MSLGTRLGRPTVQDFKFSPRIHICPAFIYRFCGVFLTPRKDDVIPSPDAARCFMRNLSAADREIDVDYYEYPDGFLK
ncbi:hypothetical protein D8B26_001237 [Coccidioides posadasii str. Silveira]|uniref:uncharacterized protein n=1 Tax=Coccidioides posadasii (strain RMSCC 757 / Silveira) TaxID=443226 RepID=UPI001BF0065F|nr:hypothetical protein D8B26_001237 [Coccidioides posadasii str. Silveira]